MPELPFEPCDKRPAKVSSTALVRYRINYYSAPTAYGFRDVLVKGFVDEVAIICGASEIARHPRVYGRGQFVFDPKHYLALLEQNPARSIKRRIRAARFPAVKSFDTFDFTAIPSLNKPLVLELARCEYIVAHDNVIALGNSGPDSCCSPRDVIGI